MTMLSPSELDGIRGKAAEYIQQSNRVVNDMLRLFAHIDELSKELEQWKECADGNNGLHINAVIMATKKLPCGHPVQCLRTIDTYEMTDQVHQMMAVRKEVCGWCADKNGK
jgi:hypothetical protein